jgi:ATP-dependent Clp protease ATP-binding subunit ClpA
VGGVLQRTGSDWLVNIDSEAEQVIARAQEIAQRRWASACGTEHLLLALVCEVRHVRQVARRFGFAELLLDAADHQPRQLPPGPPPFSPRAKEVIARAERDAMRRDARADVVDLSWALLRREDSGAANWLANYAQLDIATFRDSVHG